MKVLEFETSKGKFRVVDEKDYMVFHLMITENGFDCIELKAITEEQAREIVDKNIGYKNYLKSNDLIINFSCVTAINSLNSLLKSKGIHLFENPLGSHETALKRHLLTGTWQEQEQKTFYNPYIFKL